MIKHLGIENISFIAASSNGLSDLQMLGIVALAIIAILAIIGLGIMAKETLRLTDLIVEHNNTQHGGNGN
tara:strand:- start:148 stop:357 length:210 start_codon:yes stop_codon:yes gene_type:complete